MRQFSALTQAVRRQKKVGLSKFKGSLIYTASSKLARDTQWDPPHLKINGKGEEKTSNYIQ